MNPDGAPSILTSTLQAAGRASVWLATALAIALAGLAAVLMALTAVSLTAIGVAARIVAGALAELGRLLQAALPWLLSLAPWLLRAGITVAVMVAVVDGWPILFVAYRADVPDPVAGTMATIFVAAPIIAAVERRQWPTLLAAAPLIAGTARLLAWVGPLPRAAAIIIPLAVIVMSSIFERGDSHEFRGDDPQRRNRPAQKLAAGDSDSSYRLHDLELSPDHDGRPGHDCRHPGPGGV